MSDHQSTPRHPRVPQHASRCGAPCMSRSIRHRMCWTTRSVSSCWLPIRIGATAATWTRSSRGRSALPSWRGRASSRIWWWSRPAAASTQYVILGAGLDSFAQRRPEMASGLRIFEIDQPGPQAWKRQRLIELGFGVPNWLRFVPVDFEAGGSWRDGLVSAGFDDSKPAIVVSTGVSMYLSKEANAATLRQVAALAPGSMLAMTFLFPLETGGRGGPSRPRDGGEGSARKRHAVPQLLQAGGDRRARPRSGICRRTARLGGRSDPALLRGARTDGLRPPNNAEELLVATAG